MRDANPSDTWQHVPERVECVYRDTCDMFRGMVAANPQAKHWEMPTSIGCVKVANEEKPWSPLGTLVSTLGAPAAWMGGPNPLTLSILGGLYGAGAGAGSAALQGFMPGDDGPRTAAERRRLYRNRAIAGSLIGILPGLVAYASSASRHGPIQGLLAQWPEKPASANLSAVLDRVSRACNIEIHHTDAMKAAEAEIASRYSAKASADDWGRLLQQDRQMPDAEKAVAIGFLKAAKLACGTDTVRPWQVSAVFGAAGGNPSVGYTLGKIASTTLARPLPERNRLVSSGQLAWTLHHLLQPRN